MNLTSHIQTVEYWRQEFKVNTQELEDIYNLISEENKPFNPEELTIALIRRLMQREEEKLEALQAQGTLYRPQDNYEMGQNLVFPALNYAVGTVVGQRAGFNPEYEEFTIIEVQMADDNQKREFAANFPYPHPLNESTVEDLEKPALTPEELHEQCGAAIAAKLNAALTQESDLGFINFGKQWFLEDMLPEVTEGHLNIAEAMIDIARTALPTRKLMKEMDLPDDLRMATRVFSLNHTLQHDPRFSEVGATGQVRWYLRRMMPYEVSFPPRRLLLSATISETELPLHSDLARVEQEIDDEWTDLPAIAAPDKVMLELNYVHQRMGTLPLTWRTRGLFPNSNSGIVKVTLVDKRTEEEITAWVVEKRRYVWGLAEWYAKNNIPVGAYVTLKATDDPLVVEISRTPKRKKRVWTRIAQIVDDRLTFTMNKIQYGCEYDELSLMTDADPQQSDAYWIAAEQSGISVAKIIVELFPELAKLSPQGTVHAKTLYNAVNVVKRVPPRVIFAELSRRGCFVPAGESYWSYDETLADVEYTTSGEIEERPR